MPKNRDRWQKLCDAVAVPDGLPTREAGPWTEDKLYFWNAYIDITTRSMVGNPKWAAGLVYVDLFAGPGICEIKGTGKRIPGSSLIAANAPKPFRSILVSEKLPVLADALEARLKKSIAADRFTVFRGDCNHCVNQIANQIPAKALTLAFIDPEALHIRFETIQSLAACGRVDLLILFADYMDIVRNVDVYEKQKTSNLDQMLGPGSSWREQWHALHNRNRENICKLFADEYRRQLARLLGYKVFGEKVMTAVNGPLYRLIYASKHERGLDFWDKVTKKDRGGQTGFDFSGGGTGKP